MPVGYAITVVVHGGAPAVGGAAWSHGMAMHRQLIHHANPGVAVAWVPRAGAPAGTPAPSV